MNTQWFYLSKYIRVSFKNEYTTKFSSLFTKHFLMHYPFRKNLESTNFSHSWRKVCSWWVIEKQSIILYFIRDFGLIVCLDRQTNSGKHVNSCMSPNCTNAYYHPIINNFKFLDNGVTRRYKWLEIFDLKFTLNRCMPFVWVSLKTQLLDMFHLQMKYLLHCISKIQNLLLKKSSYFCCSSCQSQHHVSLAMFNY